MSLTIVRMNTASSQTSTVLLLTLPPLSDDLLNYCLDVEHQGAPPIELDRSSYRSRQRDLRSIRSRKLIYRHVVNVLDIVDTDADPSVQIFDQQNQPFGA
jgi:hypothetical protein